MGRVMNYKRVGNLVITNVPPQLETERAFCR
jgi:hypothetical protein